MITLLATINAALLLLTAAVLLWPSSRGGTAVAAATTTAASDVAEPASAADIAALGAEIDQLKRLVSALGSIASRPGSGGDAGLSAARALAGNGVDVGRIATECGLSAAESELLVRCASIDDGGAPVGCR